MVSNTSMATPELQTKFISGIIMAIIGLLFFAYNTIVFFAVGKTKLSFPTKFIRRAQGAFQIFASSFNKTEFQLANP